MTQRWVERTLTSINKNKKGEIKIEFTDEILYSTGQLPINSVYENPYKNMHKVRKLVGKYRTMRIKKEEKEQIKKIRMKQIQDAIHKKPQFPEKHIIIEGNSSSEEDDKFIYLKRMPKEEAKINLQLSNSQVQNNSRNQDLSFSSSVDDTSSSQIRTQMLKSHSLQQEYVPSKCFVKLSYIF